MGPVTAAWGAGRVRGSLERDPREQDSLEDALRPLAREFRRWEFGLITLHRGLSLTAQRRDGSSEPGLCLVITDNPAEMRQVLAEDSPPACRGHGPGGNQSGGG